MKSASWLIASVLALSVAACQQPQPEAPKDDRAASTPVAPPVGPTAPLSAAETAQAFQAAWDQAPPVRRPAPEESGGGQFTFDSGRLTPLGGDRYALVSEGQGEDAHVSPGALAIHYVTRTADGFRRADADPLILTDGTFGKAPDWSIREGLLPAPALLTESGGTWQGYTCTGADVVELTPQRPILRAANVKLHYSDASGNPNSDGGQIDGRFEPGAPGRDFKVRYVGSRSALVTWRLGADGTYTPVDEPADLPWC